MGSKETQQIGRLVVSLFIGMAFIGIAYGLKNFSQTTTEDNVAKDLITVTDPGRQREYIKVTEYKFLTPVI